MTTPTTKEDLATRIREHAMFSESDLRYLRAKGYTDDEILAFWDRDHAMGKTPVNHANTRITTIHIQVESVDTQVRATASHDIDQGLSVYRTGMANVAVGDNYAPTYSFDPINIDSTRKALAKRIFDKDVDALNAGQSNELDTVLRACMLVANVTRI